MTALAGCAADGTSIDAISAFRQTCVKGDTSVNCGTADNGNGNGGGNGGGNDPVVNTNTGNNTDLTTGDTTIVLENSVLVSDANNPAKSQLTVTNSPSKARILIDTNTADQADWPKTKDLSIYPAGTASFTPAVAGETYKEYRALSASSSGVAVDEELQVWSWNDGSYGTQYRDVTGGGGGDALHQAWSVGGKVATSIPTSGTVNFNNGVFRGTAKTWNWTEPTGQPNRTVAVNNTWAVRGTAQVAADYSTGAITGTLTPTMWNAMDKSNYHQDVVANSSDVNFVSGFMTNTIALNGTLASKGTGSGKTYDGTYNGTSTFDPAPGWITSGTQNVMTGSLYGNGPVTSTAGVYALLATAPSPIGGTNAIDNDTRGFISESGVFHAQ
ncbi:MAG: hypothetical protein ABIN69_10560 [Aestuariivirga sp.]